MTICRKIGTFEIRNASPLDVELLAENIRPLDKAEAWAAQHWTPREAIQSSYVNSTYCYTVMSGDEIVAMFGLVPISLLEKRALVWMLTSQSINKVKTRFLRESKAVVQDLLGFYPTLFNWVDDRHAPCLRWLAWCGATVQRSLPFGEDNLPFHFFTLGEH